MTVSRKKHVWTIAILYAAITILAGAVIFLIIKDEFFTHPSADYVAPIETTKDDSYLKSEEIIIIETPIDGEEETVILPVEKVLFEYVEVKDSCDVHYEGDCVLVRSEPSTDASIVTRLRNHVVLRVGGKVEYDNRTWYKIIFDEYLRYPERVSSDWYIASEFVDVLLDEGDKTVWEDGSTTTEKRIVVSRGSQKLFAYEGETLFMETAISTGLELTPTPRGIFTVFKKTPSRYMQGPLPGFTDYHDLPGVPWNLYFTHGGAVIHGAYWHDSFGSRYSHGCVNLSPEDARKLYEWAELGTKVIVE